MSNTCSYGKLLDDIGFHDGLLVEAIVSTIDRNGRPNAAPIGVIRNGDILTLKVYRETKTYENIKYWKRLVINLTFDVELFYRTLFKIKLDELFDYSVKIPIPPLKGVDAYIEAEVFEEEEGEERGVFHTRIIRVNVIRRMPHVFSRCISLVIESLIHFTRIKVFIEKSDMDKVIKLKELINNYYSIIRRNCRKGLYIHILSELISKINEYEKSYCGSTSENSPGNTRFKGRLR